MSINSDGFSEFMTPEEAWTVLSNYREQYYRKYVAAYSGDRRALAMTAENDTFWKRNGKCKIHVPIAADIAATSADLLFSEEVRFSCFDEETEDDGSQQQKRLDELVMLNNIHAKLNEAAETCAALGDVYLKLNWRQNELDHPILTVVQADSAIPEYSLGILKCVHFFTLLRISTDQKTVWRIYERYEAGKISMAIYKGDTGNLGARLADEKLAEIGYESEIKTPIDEMLAVHVPNVKPNRRFRSSELGRSDSDGLRDLMDSLDEAYSSWVRDVRLGKARTIVPAEYLKRKPQDLFVDGSYTYEFDEDVETLVTLDLDTDKPGTQAITSLQFEIRADQHEKTCRDLIEQIVSKAGYSPQTFGIGIDGNAQSGTALHIREKKSFETRGKKQTYWQGQLEKIMTAMIHLDAAIYPGKGSDMDDSVKAHFSDSMSSDMSTISQALDLLNRASAISTEAKVEALHPDWTKKAISEEVERIKTENGMNVEPPNAMLGDYGAPISTEQEGGENE